MLSAMSELRQRKSTSKTSKEQLTIVEHSSAHTVTIDLSEGHLGVSLNDAYSGCVIIHAVSKDLLSQAGLKAGDVITKLDGVPVKSHLQAIDQMNNAKGKSLVIEYITAGAHC